MKQTNVFNNRNFPLSSLAVLVVFCFPLGRFIGDVVIQDKQVLKGCGTGIVPDKPRKILIKENLL